MWVDFNNLNASSRIWIYQANRALSGAEEKELTGYLKHFCEEWQTHGQPMRASCRIEYSQFVILAADEDYQQPSGCSIDSSVRLLKQWQQKNGIDFFDRTQIPFLINNKIQLHPLTTLKALVAEGKLTEHTLTFDNLVPSLGDWSTRWKVPAGTSWLSKYLEKKIA